MSSILILIFGSLVLLVLFICLTLFTLSFTIYKWENDKISTLTDKIKPSEKNILNKRLALKSSSPIVDIPKSKKKKAIKAVSKASKVYKNSISSLQKNDYPEWVNSSVGEISKFKNNSWKSTKKLVSHLISLTKPIEEAKAEEEKKTLTEKILKKLPGNYTPDIYDDNFDEIKARKEIAKKDVSEVEKEKEEKLEKEVIKEISTAQKAQQATLGLASKLKTDKDEDLGLFEKLETKLLAKLQDSGMADYDIWLDLGDLYAKYGEDRKAKEIYALVLKHSQEKNLKERATNKLIGL